MKTITFYVEHFTTSEIEMNVPDEVWQPLQDTIDNGGSVEDVFDDLMSRETFYTRQGQINILPAITAYDLSVADCDCDKTKTEE